MEEVEFSIKDRRRYSRCPLPILSKLVIRLLVFYLECDTVMQIKLLVR